MSKNTNLSFLTDYITADITNGRIGINNASPAYAFDVTGIARTSTSTYLATASGKLGIGTTTPTDKLEVQDGDLSTYHNANAATAGYGINFYTNGGGSKNSLAYIVLSQVGTARSGDLLFQTSNSGAPAERMRITSAGTVSIGTTASQYGNLNVKSNGTLSYQGFNLYAQGNGNFTHLQHSGSLGIIGTTYDGTAGTGYTPLTFWTSDVERMRITSAGNVGIGTSSPSQKLEVAGNIRSILTGTTDITTIFTENNVGSVNQIRTFGTSVSGTQFGINRAGYSSIDTNNGLGLLFGTTDVAPIIIGTNNTERMRMLANGNLSIGTTGDVGAKIYIVGTTSYGIVYQNNASVNNFYLGVGGDGYLRASAWSYGSDIRMKENISDVTNGLDLVSKLKPKHFDYIDGIKNNLGFIAQDVQELIPQAVSISDEKTGMLGLKTDFIIPYLVKSIQELSAEITILKNK